VSPDGRCRRTTHDGEPLLDRRGPAQRGPRSLGRSRISRVQGQREVILNVSIENDLQVDHVGDHTAGDERIQILPQIRKRNAR
jgi:hypothetical protein